MVHFVEEAHRTTQHRQRQPTTSNVSFVALHLFNAVSLSRLILDLTCSCPRPTLDAPLTMVSPSRHPTARKPPFQCRCAPPRCSMPHCFSFPCIEPQVSSRPAFATWLQCDAGTIVTLRCEDKWHSHSCFALPRIASLSASYRKFIHVRGAVVVDHGRRVSRAAPVQS